MAAVGFSDAEGERVAAVTRDAFSSVLGDRLVCIAGHGSSVTGYVPGLSDFDFVVFMHGEIDTRGAVDLHAKLADAHIAPFTYLQISRVHNVDLDGTGRHTGLIDGVYALIHGEIPGGWEFHTEDELRASGRDGLRQMINGWRYRYEHWAVDASGWHSDRRIRLFMTEVKPNLRALLVELGEPVREVWASGYLELVRRLERHDQALASRIGRLLANLPAPSGEQGRVGQETIELLDEMSRKAATLLKD